MMAKWSNKMMAETPEGWKEQLMGLCGGANQSWGLVAGKAVDTWNTCPHCNCKEGHLHDKFCPTQLRLREDNPADKDECPTCERGVCQCGPDEDTCPKCCDPICNCWLEDDDESTEEFRSVFVKPEYSDLFGVLRDALEEAQEGKGAVRHGNGLSFMDQPALTITRAVGLGFPLGQAMKKIQECQRMDTDAAKRELLGAINYLAAAVLFLDE